MHWPVLALGYQCRAVAPGSLLLLFAVRSLKDAISDFTNSSFSGVSAAPCEVMGQVPAVEAADLPGFAKSC